VKALSGKKFARLLESHGWSLQRINASHDIYAKAGSQSPHFVPTHRNETLKVGLQRHLMKLAGLLP
jgi:predicted RNA binding protein YcfA (HicA-like mRNA interferase family)